jgi:hypothetical protein
MVPVFSLVFEEWIGYKSNDLEVLQYEEGKVFRARSYSSVSRGNLFYSLPYLCPEINQDTHSPL